jgi:ABC transporter with metal-binding/Fe-S-binding domain ATP-binding protein
VKCAVLFSGGKDSTYAAFLARKVEHEISCLITIISDNPESYMFHTSSISKVKKPAEVMDIPLIIQQTKGEKEKELVDLEKAIQRAIDNYNVEAVVTGAVESAYQASRVQRICDNLGIECFNPLWQKDQFELLEDLLENNFKIIITGVFAYPLDEKWLGLEINKHFINNVKSLYKRYKINPAGEGGEFETLVLNCPLFQRELIVKDKQISGKNNSWKIEADII